jgi:iron complex outermembrane receptor protein
MTWDKKNGEDNSIPGTPLPFTYKNHRATFNVGANYKPWDGVMTYIKYSTGFISGGFLATRAYNPEIAKSWEGGLKADWFDNRLRTNLAVFYTDYTQLQQTSSGILFGVPQAQQIIFNSGNARAKGFELEMTAVPVDRLTFTAGIGFTDFRFLFLDPRLNSSINLRQNNTQYPVYRPKWTVDLSGQYETEPLFNDSTMVFRVDGTFSGAHYTATTAPFQTPTVFATPYDVLTATRVPADWLMNARITLTNVNIADNVTADISAWGRNINNNRNVEFTASFGFLYGATYARAPTYGVDVTFRY